MLEALRDAGPTHLRFPGGCMAHRWNWRGAVGPATSRAQAFGLPEFLTLCAEMGAEPVITLADATPDDHAASAGALARYLLGTDANDELVRLRAADGHPAPWPVRCFEYGNETFHGDHDDFSFAPGTVRPILVEDYIARYRAVRAAVRTVAAAACVAAVLDNDIGQITPWTRAVVESCAGEADAFITHVYLPFAAQAPEGGLARLWPAMAAAPLQVEARLAELAAFVLEAAGRDVPLWISEYNAGLPFAEPPARYSLAAAVEVADLARALMVADAPIAHAQYWHAVSGWWGMLARGADGGLVRHPAWHAFAIYHRHLGHVRYRCEVAAPRDDVAGGWEVRPAVGDARPAAMLGETAVTGWTAGALSGVETRVHDDGAEVTLADGHGDYWHAASSALPLPAGAGLVEVEGELTATGAAVMRLQVGDARGWEATRSALQSDDVSGVRRIVRLAYRPPPDAAAVTVTLRIAAGGPGTAALRAVRVRFVREATLGAVGRLAALVTDGPDGGASRTCFLINRHASSALRVRLIGARSRSAAAEVLTGTSLDADADAATVPLAVDIVEDDAIVVIPPHSFAAVALRR